jgi:hypothetical protein
MKIERLKEYINKNNFNLDFETDGIGMTWGVSYVRLTIGIKRKFENIEHFFFSTLKSKKNQTSGIYEQLTWAEKTDLSNWSENLKIKEVKIEELIKFIDSSINDIKENEKYWIIENTIDTSFFDSNKKYETILLINETVYPRHHINTTDMYLTIDNYYYYYFEGHWES